MEEYWSHAGATFEGYGAKHLAAYTPFKLLEGKGPAEGIVPIEFPDMEAARRWYESAAYQAVKQYREGAADIELILGLSIWCGRRRRRHQPLARYPGGDNADRKSLIF
jgi:uncharacterized protein (DUF1330 family)